MNMYLLVIILIIVLDWLLDEIKFRAIIKSLDPVVPAEFKDVVDAQEYHTNQNYNRRQVNFKRLKGYWGLLETILILGFGLFGILHRFVAGISENIYLQGIMFWAIFIGSQIIIDLPWGAYETFRIEEEFGMNKTTPKTFVSDIFKKNLLVALIGTPILLFVIYFFSNVSMAWLWIWAGITLFSLIMNYLAQDLIMPLFNKYTPLEEGELKDMITAYTTKQNIKLKGIYRMDGSRRSTKGNAYYSGFGNSKRIVLFDTLIEELSPEEIVGVLAHEVGHGKLNHITKMMVSGSVKMLIMIGFIGLFIDQAQFYAAFGIEGSPIYAGLALVMFLFAPVMLIISILGNYFSRAYEFQADAFARSTTGNAEALISGLKKLYVSSKNNLTPPKILVVLKYSHPPILERIKALKS